MQEGSSGRGPRQAKSFLTLCFHLFLPSTFSRQLSGGTSPTDTTSDNSLPLTIGAVPAAPRRQGWGRVFTSGFSAKPLRPERTSGAPPGGVPALCPAQRAWDKGDRPARARRSRDEAPLPTWDEPAQRLSL